MSQTMYEASAGTSANQRALLQLVALPVIGFVVFFAALSFGLPSNRILLMGLALLAGTLILMVTGVDRALPREKRNLLLSLFTFAYVVRFVLPAFIFYVGTAGYDPDLSPNPSPIPLTPADVSRGMLAAIVGYAMLLGGFALPFGRTAAKVVALRREWSLETTLVVALIMIPLGWAVVLVSELGLIPARAGSGVLGTISTGSLYGIGLIALAYMRYRSRIALILLCIMIPPTMLFNFFTGSKLLFLMPLLMIALTHILVSRRMSGWWVVGGLAAMTLLYPIGEAYRRYAWDNHFTTLEVMSRPSRVIGLIASIVSMPPAQYLEQGITTTGARLDGLGVLSVILRDTGTRVPYQWGRSLTYIPLSYVPRLLWPSKPLFDTGQWVTDHYGYGPEIRSSTGCTWLGELYFNFGWAGIVVGMALLGIWFRFLQDWFLRIDATIPALLAGIVTVLTLAHSLEGDLVSPTSGLVFRIAPLILTHILVVQLTRAPARPPPPM